MLKDKITSNKVEINAPIDLVWDILTDLESYPDWNPFTTHAESSLRVGEKVKLHVNLPKRGDRKHVEEVRSISKPNQMVWKAKYGGSMMLKKRREQNLEKINRTTCTYQTSDAFYGTVTPIVLSLFEDDLVNGFNDMAYALKDRAEAFYQKSLKIA